MGSPAYLLQPWRYDFEYARAWLRTGFPVFGLEAPVPHTRSMGGKGWISIPRLHNMLMLGVNTAADDWSVGIESRNDSLDLETATRWAESGCARQAGYRQYSDGTIDCSPTPTEHGLLVDGAPQNFVGFAIDSVWVGSAEIAGVMVTVTADGVDPEQLELAKITDVGPYLTGQRAYMRG